MTGETHPEFPILLIDDEPSWLRSLGLLLERAGFTRIIKLTDGEKVKAGTPAGLPLGDPQKKETP